MTEIAIEPDPSADRTEPGERPTRWVLRRAPEHPDKITVAWLTTDSAESFHAYGGRVASSSERTALVELNGA